MGYLQRRSGGMREEVGGENGIELESRVLDGRCKDEEAHWKRTSGERDIHGKGHPLRNRVDFLFERLTPKSSLREAGGLIEICLCPPAKVTKAAEENADFTFGTSAATGPLAKPFLLFVGHAPQQTLTSSSPCCFRSRSPKPTSKECASIAHR